ncbi:DEAD/DEAH box helicase [Nocardia sp. CDC160]|uniref:DEAD/DEAH box helicase n=1 Tax=Nocardia sp. CDC160 TaxID=3112166 RepID=UPI002DBF8C2D|nr:DEAD/DEAH box helicase [Nocardia sp. CDC160]MEC3918518.1 DEAD/DEAH box helicase [Nocardia sp. CDC160]
MPDTHRAAPNSDSGAAHSAVPATESTPPNPAMEATIHTDPTSDATHDNPAGGAEPHDGVTDRRGRGRRAGTGAQGEVRFAELGLPPVLVQALRRDGIDKPFPIQAAVIPDILAGRDVLGRAATGSGKTLAFGLPMLVRLFGAPSAPKRPRGLILAPTRELAIQIESALDEPALSLGLRLATAVGGLPIKKQEERLARGVDVVIATPGRLTDLLGRKAVALSDIRVVTVDEADHMAELGFMPQLTALLNKVPDDAQQLLFSATLDETIDGLVQRYLREPIRHSVGPGATAANSGATANSDAAADGGARGSNIGSTGQDSSAGPRLEAGLAPGDHGASGQAAAGGSAADEAQAAGPAGGTAAVPAIAHYALHVRRSDKRAVVSEIAAREGRTLLFVRTQYGAEKLAGKLREVGIGAVALHGGKAQNQRSRMLAAFADGTAPVLVATDVAARGLHVDDVSLVVHVDPPADPKDYLHRTGRTARAGASGTVVTIVTPDNREEAAQLAKRASVTLTDVEVRPGDRRLVEITGARRPSGRPVSDPSTPAAPEPDSPREQSRFRQRPKGESRPHNKKRKPGAARKSSR